MAEIDFKEDFLRLVQRCVMDLRQLRDPDGLIEPFRQVLIKFRDAIITGASLKTEAHVLEAWRRLGDIFDYHEPHYKKQEWFKEMLGMVQTDCRAMQEALADHKARSQR